MSIAPLIGTERPRSTRPARLLTAAAVLSLAASLCAAAPPPPAAAADTLRLPAPPMPWPEENPYRGNKLAVAIGRDAFNHFCARCHGLNADASRSPAPDVRRIGGTCKRVRDPALQQRCTQDADVYFRDSVLKGKVKVGVRHMPAWQDVLTPELVWAIRSYVESPAAGTQQAEAR
jgi:mono/diheme cytochrome c family protein